MYKRQLVLEDGTVFIGKGFGSDRLSSGEVVFNTGMTGYQEVITDPSYYGQIVTMTYPLVGNYGINRDDFETVTPFIKGFVVKEVSEHPSNFRNDESLDHFLKAHDIPGISGIDTRKLTKIIRKHGTMKAMITDTSKSAEDIVSQLKEMKLPTDQVKMTSTIKPYVVPGRGMRIVMVDFGAKHGILRELTKRDCHITVVPYNYSAENILRLKPDGMLLTNGPGDPKDVPEAIEMIKQVIGKIPIFGICLGHQLLALANGADTKKMKFGHRGANHPVKDIRKNKTYLTSQNHSYTVSKASLENTELELTQVALNDDTVEGIAHIKHLAFSVQYHPEAAPGPEDTNYLFDRFLQMIKSSKNEEEAYA
ncbi:glutamine-hydrolyzing carbamoyl-phosphate synthase small subunit [Oceanobacillus sp. 143]|uniref:Carbamoyl phosphate synthase small chain n=1 Tax=Oceanobacillus zhaokaii TaxID=2052660 RepID=A0A345PG88_9BACI|nr:carbamoyl phosphate synthase small subunit [Oceanobacillus zhaokaii]AXI09018.1 carbamoyl phosphate synthase small subunit [Oceanobacillus zhaokaii]QGS68612.1 glutamine-hydrolyzing carbamoyl-phosphate synthase small subunit [Oceanobacillus sp. 143]